MNWGFRNSSVATAIGIGVGATLVLDLIVVIALLLFADGSKAVADNAALIAALTALGGVFTTQMVNNALEDRRARNNSALEDRRAGAAALQAYLEQMGNLLEKQGVLKEDKGVDSLTQQARDLAQAHTLAVLEGLEPEHKRIVVRFLYESRLIPREVRNEEGRVVKEKVVNLSGANLRDADLFGLNLREAGLDGAFLERANLRHAQLPEANLGGTWLHGADLTHANLCGASLREANLQLKPEADPRPANLSGADLTGADLYKTNLSDVDLRESKGLTQRQTSQAKGNRETTLPSNCRHPEAWV